MARLKVKQISDFTSSVNSLITASTFDESSLETVDSNVSNALSSQIDTFNTAEGSLEVIDSAISNALSTHIDTFGTAEGSLEVIDSAISNALSTQIDVFNAAEGSLETRIAANEGDSQYVKQYGVFRSTTQFDLSTAVEFASDDDILVFINGHQIGHKVGEAGQGWSSSDGQSFTLSNIGYNLEADDVVYVTAHN